MYMHHAVQETDLQSLLQCLQDAYVVPQPKNYGVDKTNIVIEPHYDIKVRDTDDPDGTNFGLQAQIALYSELVKTAKDMCSLCDESTCQVSLTYYAQENGKFSIETHV
jgi:hypothetical protein